MDQMQTHEKKSISYHNGIAELIFWLNVLGQ